MDIYANEKVVIAGILDARYEVMYTIGDGAYAKVKLAREFATKELVALKIMKQSSISTDEGLSKFIQEVSILSQCKHFNVIEIKHATVMGTLVKNNGKVKHVAYYAMKHAQYGELFKLIINTGPLPECLARYLFKQIINGVEHMHSLGMCHRDLKSENMLIDNDMTIKLADFGSAASLKLISKDPVKYSKEVFGSKEYNAPEISQRAFYEGDKADIFSLGICLFVMVCGHMPFRQASLEDAHYRRFCLNKSKYWSIYKMECSNEFKDMFERMAERQESRASIAEIKVHPWMQKYDPPEVLHELVNRAHIHAGIIRKELLSMIEQKQWSPAQSPHSSDEELSITASNKQMEDAEMECMKLNVLMRKDDKCGETDKHLDN